MHDVLLILHLLGLGGGAASVIAGPLLRRQIGAEPNDAPALARLQPVFSRVGQIGLAILLVTGLWMLLTTYDGGAGLPWTFWAKLVFVVALTAGVVTLEVGGRRARAGSKSARARLPLIGAITTLFLLLVIIFAVLTFH